MKVLVCGDCHGAPGTLAADRLAKELNAGAVILLGDVWDMNLHRPEPIVPMEAVLGNHERWNLVVRNEVGPGLRIHHDYSRFELGGVKFGVIGRIDDTPRIRELMSLGLFLGDPNNMFFAQLEGQKVRDALGGSDVLLFHDAPFPFVLGHRPLAQAKDYIGAGPVDTEVVGSRYLNEVIRTIEPKLVFHGHMHLLDIRYIKRTRVYGLPPIDPTFALRGYVLLDTATLRAQYFDMPGAV